MRYKIKIELNVGGACVKFHDDMVDLRLVATLLAVVLLTPLLVYVELRATHPIVPFIVRSDLMDPKTQCL